MLYMDDCICVLWFGDISGKNLRKGKVISRNDVGVSRNGARRGFTQRRKEGFHATAQRRNVISCITLRRCAVA